MNPTDCVIIFIAAIAVISLIANSCQFRRNSKLNSKLRKLIQIYTTSEISPDRYQQLCVSTAVYPRQQKIVYPALGLVNESGEVAGKIKKYLRGDFELTAEKRDAIAKEIGDTLWYSAVLADDLGVTLSSVMLDNVKKLQSRKERGTIKGDGDQR